MITRLKEILGGIEKISAWRIIDREIRDLIHQSLDSARYVRTEHYPLVEPGSEPVGIPKNSLSSAPVDADGFALSSTNIVEAGLLKRFWGPVRICHYLDVPHTD
jgi:hypothetical protein